MAAASTVPGPVTLSKSGAKTFSLIGAYLADQTSGFTTPGAMSETIRRE